MKSIVVLLFLTIPSAFAAGNPCSGNTTGQQASYCNAASNAQNGNNTNKVLSAVWSGVAVVCTAGCANKFVPKTPVCTGANLGAQGTDGAMTQQFAQGLVGAGSSASTLAAGSAGSAGSSDGLNLADCAQAVSATGQAIEKFESAQSQGDTAQANTNAAQGLQGPGSVTAPGQMDLSQSAATAGSSPGGSGITPSGPNAALCAQGAAGNASAAMQCALASDSSLPPAVASPQFAQDFQNLTGMSLPDFLAKADSPKQAIEGALGGSGKLNADQLGKLDSAIDQFQKKFQSSDTAHTLYASGAGAGGDSAGMPDMSQIMSGLMKQFGPQGKDDPVHGFGAVVFANQNRNPASVAEDRRLSIFDRITYRYSFVGRRILFGN